MADELTKKHCVPCEGGVAPLSKSDAQAYLVRIDGWSLSDDNASISRKFDFTNFKETMAFVNRVAELAEQEGHHPDMHVSYANLEIVLTTHAIGGLSENDFILAAKVNEIQ